MRLVQFRVDPGGIASAYRAAPGGSFGKVVVGDYTGGGDLPTRMAIKIIPVRPNVKTREAWTEEVKLLRRLRNYVDSVRAQEASDNPLALVEHGARHVSYIYGSGHELSLAGVDAELPAMEAYTIAMAPLEQTLSSFLAKSRTATEIAAGGIAPRATAFPLQQPALEVVIRCIRDVANGLAFLRHASVVVSACADLIGHRPRIDVIAHLAYTSTYVVSLT